MTLASDAPTPATIVFGTDGWRARIADEFTFDNVRRCADGVAQYVVERGEQARGVVIAYDRRGHGKSEIPSQQAPYTVEVLTDDLRGLLDALEIPAADLFGCSGGAITTSHSPGRPFFI